MKTRVLAIGDLANNVSTIRKFTKTSEIHGKNEKIKHVFDFFNSIVSATARNLSGWTVNVSAGFVDVPRAPEARPDDGAA